MGIADREYMKARYRRLKGLDEFGDSDRRRLGQTRPKRDSRKLNFRQFRTYMPLIALAYIATQHSQHLTPWLSPIVQFPESGSVTVSTTLETAKANSHFQITASDKDSVIQLFDPATDAHILSIYIRRNETRRVPVPSGTFTIRIAQGLNWYGQHRFFGETTKYDRANENMTFTKATGNRVIVASPLGNMPMTPERNRPPRL